MVYRKLVNLSVNRDFLQNAINCNRKNLSDLQPKCGIDEQNVGNLKVDLDLGKKSTDPNEFLDVSWKR